MGPLCSVSDRRCECGPAEWVGLKYRIERQQVQKSFQCRIEPYFSSGFECPITKFPLQCRHLFT
jgi:hypothetical protein